MRPLDGVKVLDLTQKITGNLTTMYLANFGAEVIKIEKPGIGDVVRTWKPLKDGKSAYFAYLNREKKSVTLDINSDEGKAIIKKLVKECDVICENFEPDFMDSIGLGYESLKEINPEIVYASCSYFGDSGPYKNKPGTSYVAQSLGVAMDMTGTVGSYPIRTGPSIGEHYCAGYVATGIMLALINRKLNDEGQKVNVSLQDSLYSIIEAAPAACSLVDEIQTRKGNFDPACAPYDTFKTNDGYVAIGVATEAQWVKLCHVFDMTDFIDHPIYGNNIGRCDDYLNKLRPILEEYTMKHSKDDIEKGCREVGIPCGAVLDVPGIMNHPQITENNFVVEMEDKEVGKFKIPTLPIDLSETPAKLNASAPVLGENTEEILTTIGYKNEEIDNLRKNNII